MLMSDNGDQGFRTSNRIKRAAPNRRRSLTGELGLLCFLFFFFTEKEAPLFKPESISVHLSISAVLLHQHLGEDVPSCTVSLCFAVLIVCFTLSGWNNNERTMRG